jgi:hypothetical protein
MMFSRWRLVGEMPGNSETYTQRIEAMRANLEVDERLLGEMIRSGAPRDHFGRDRTTLEAEIARQNRRITIAASY